MKKINIWFAATLLLGFTACNSVLDVKPKGSYTTGNYWRNQADVIDGISGIYNILLEEDFTGHAEFTFDICSDDEFRAGDHAEDAAIETFTYDAGNPQVNFSWKWKYEMINRANNALTYIPNVPGMDAAIRDRSLGEAHFLRAFAYWRLTLIYGEVPMVTEEDVKKGAYNHPKATVEALRTQIEADLLKAAELLPAKYDESQAGRVHKGSAWGLLTKLYLYWDKLDKAIEFGSKVVGNNDYRLAANYADNFTTATSNNPEMLFNIQTMDGWGYSDFTTYHTPREWGGWNFHQPLKELVNEFEPNDPRKAVSVMQDGDMINVGNDVKRYNASMSNTGYHFRKFTNWKSNGGLDYSLNTPLLRTADIYLLLAEAKIRKNGAGAGDAEINAVRRRASVLLPPVVGGGMAAVIHERRVELSGENERHQDLMRWDKAGIVNIAAMYSKPKTGPAGVLVPARTFQKPKHYYFPLPQAEVDRSRGVLEQNPNYK